MTVQGQGSVVTEKFTGVKVFSATMAKERDQLGDRVTDWIRHSPALSVVSTVITQSSDEAFHCLTITVFYTDAKKN